MTELDRALGCLTGLALGDALGMPTQSMSPAEIDEDYGEIRTLLPAGPRQQIARNMPAGQITDDTEQALLVAGLLLDGRGRLDPERFAAALIEWERRMAAAGSLDLLGPSTTRAVHAILGGTPASEAGKTGTTNGAAMRIAPVGIATPADDIETFLDAVVEAARVTHDTSIGIAGAAAIGAAVSTGVAGGTTVEAIAAAIVAARAGERRGHWVAGASVAERAERAVDLLAAAPPEEHAELLRRVVGTSVASQESVPAALAIAATATDAWAGLCLAAGLGGDTDTIGAMAGAVLGAVHGRAAWPEEAVARVTEVNGLDLAPVASGLLALRAR